MLTTDMGGVIAKEEHSALDDFYGISYLWYSVCGTIVFLVVALIVSFLTGPTNPKNVDSKLMAPLFYNCCPFLPEKYRHRLLFGVDYSNKGDTDVKLDTRYTLSKEQSVINDTQVTETSLHISTHI